MCSLTLKNAHLWLSNSSFSPDMKPTNRNLWTIKTNLFLTFRSITKIAENVTGSAKERNYDYISLKE